MGEAIRVFLLIEAPTGEAGFYFRIGDRPAIGPFEDRHEAQAMAFSAHVDAEANPELELISEHYTG